MRAALIGRRTAWKNPALCAEAAGTLASFGSNCDSGDDIDPNPSHKNRCAESADKLSYSGPAFPFPFKPQEETMHGFKSARRARIFASLAVPALILAGCNTTDTTSNSGSSFKQVKLISDTSSISAQSKDPNLV